MRLRPSARVSSPSSACTARSYSHQFIRPASAGPSTTLNSQLTDLGIPLTAELQQVDPSGLGANVSLLLQVQPRQRVAQLLKTHPELLTSPTPLADWLDFLAEYGISKHHFARLLSTHTELFTHGSLYTAGNSMLYLQGLGLSTRDISATIIPKAAEVLGKPHGSTMQPVVNFLLAPLPNAEAAQAVPRQAAQDSSSTNDVQDSSSTNDVQGSQSTCNSSTCGDSTPLSVLAEAGPVDGQVAAQGLQGDNMYIQQAGSVKQPAVAWGLGLDRMQLRSLLSRCPRLLLMSPQQDLQPKAAYLQHVVGFTVEQVQLLLTSASALLLASDIRQPVQAHMEFLTGTCGYTLQQARAILVQCPECFALSISNLQRKWHYITTTMFGPHTMDVLQASAVYPSLNSHPTPNPQRSSSHVDSQQPVGHAPDTLGGTSCSKPPDDLTLAAVHEAAWQQLASAAETNGSQVEAGETTGSQPKWADWDVQAAKQPRTGATLAQAAVLAYPSAFSHSLLNDMGPRFSYASDHELLHHFFEYDEQVHCVSLSLRKLLEGDTSRFLALACGEQQHFQAYCQQWRRTAGSKLTVTSSNLTENSW